MTEPGRPGKLVASFPAAGGGGATQEHLEKHAARRGLACAAVPNPHCVEVLGSGEWHEQAIDEIEHAADRASADRVVLAGHSMGGLAAIVLSGDIEARIGRPVRVLAVNTPCPDQAGRIPTMSGLSDTEIAGILAQDGFPPELLEDDDLLAEIASGLRKETRVADRLAALVSAAGDLSALHVLSLRGDKFIPPERCAAWRHRVVGEFQLTIAEGSHTISEVSSGSLGRALDSAVASVEAMLRE